MELVHGCTEAQEDLAIVFETLAELALHGAFEPVLHGLCKTILATPLGQHIVRPLPSIKADFAGRKRFVSTPVHLRCLAQHLSAQLVRDGQPVSTLESVRPPLPRLAC